jgi:hypothetical protein
MSREDIITLDPVHMATVLKGELEFDKTFKPNNLGYSSHRDYSYKKQDSTTYRIMVLGDSFSDACFSINPGPISCRKF